ncbi:MAG: TolC family protein [Nitritalea sp.]
MIRRRMNRLLNRLWPVGLPILMLLGLSLLVQRPARGQDFQTLLEEALRENPQAKAAAQRHRAALERAGAAGFLPDPELQVGVFTRPMELLMGDQRGEGSLMQMFPWFGMLKAEKAEAAAMAEAVHASYREVLTELAYALEISYLEVYRLQELQEIDRQNIALLEALEELALIRLQGGDGAVAAVRSVLTALPAAASSSAAPAMGGMEGMGGSAASGSSSASASGGGAMGSMETGSGSDAYTGILRLRMQRKALESALEQRRDDLELAYFQIGTLLGRAEPVPVQATLGAAGTRWQLPNAQELPLEVLEANPMLAMLAKEQQAREQEAKMARLEGAPMIGLGLSYMVFSPRPEMGAPGPEGGMFVPMGMGDNMVMPMVSLNLPLYRRKYKAKARAAQEEAGALVHQQDQVRQELLLSFQGLHRDKQEAERRQQLLAEQVALLEEALRWAGTALVSSAGSLSEVVSVQQELLSYQAQRIEAEVAVEKVRAAYDRLAAKHTIKYDESN